MRLRFLIPALCFAPALPSLAAAGPVSISQSSAVPTLASDPLFDFGGFHFEQAVPWLSAGNGATNDHWASDEFLLGRYTLPFISARWVFTANNEVQGTPTVENGKVYVADMSGVVWQLDATTGKPIWQADLTKITGNSMAYSRNSPAIGTNNVFVGDQDSSNLYAFAKADGSLKWKTALDSEKGAFVTSSPVVANGKVYVGVASMQETLAARTPGFVPTFRGSVVALDETTGQILWKAYTVPTGYTGGSVWESNIAVDTARSAIYVTSGNNYSVPASVAACQLAARSTTEQDACLSPDDHIDSVISLNMDSGTVNWAQRFTHADTWTASCESYGKNHATPCPAPTGLDTDFGAGANLFTVTRNGQTIDAVGAGQKSGAYFTMNRDTGAILWGTQVGPDGVIGGIQWGSAVDDQRIYVPNGNSQYTETTLIPSGVKTNGGFWSALDKNTGQILWQTPTTAPSVAPSAMAARAQVPPPNTRAIVEGSVAVANGVMYGEDVAGYFVALDAATGEVMRYAQSGGAGISAPAIVDGVLYWASGYGDYGATNNKVYALWIGIQ